MARRMAEEQPIYDLILLLDPSAEEERRSNILASLEQVIERQGAIVSRHDWGLRPTAYEVRKRADADYHLLQFQGPAELLQQLDHALKITDGVNRFRIIKLRKGTPEPPDLTMSAARGRRGPGPGRDRALERFAVSRSLQRLCQEIRPACDPFGDRADAARRLGRTRNELGLSREGKEPLVAATNINRVVLTGNLTADPELRSLASGNSVCKLRIACNTRRKNNATGTWEDKPNYFDVTVWGAQGENCARFLSKGRPVAIDGRLEWREWETPEGHKRQAVDIIADAVQFLGGRDDARRRWRRLHPALRRPGRRPRLPARRRGRRVQRPQRAGGRRHPVLGGAGRPPPSGAPRRGRRTVAERDLLHC